MTPEYRFALYMTMAHIGAAATVMLIGSLLFDWSDTAKGIPMGMLLVSVAMLLSGRLRDEYVETLWRAGASAAFGAVMLCFILVPLVIGAFAGTTPPRMSIGVEWPAAVALLAFFGGFYAARLKPRR